MVGRDTEEGGEDDGGESRGGNFGASGSIAGESGLARPKRIGKLNWVDPLPGIRLASRILIKPSGK